MILFSYGYTSVKIHLIGLEGFFEVNKYLWVTLSSDFALFKALSS
jgi:hypothetical protein